MKGMEIAAAPFSLRQQIRAGMDRAKTRGKSIGRPRVQLDENRIRRLRDQGYSFAEIGSQIGADKMTVHRRLKPRVID